MNDWFEAEQRIERAQQLSESQCWEEALAEIEAALEINPHNAAWHAHRGYLLDELERYAEAVEAYERSIELEPDDRDVLVAYGAGLSRLRRFTKALTVFRELARQYPDFEPAYCQRIAIYTDLERHDQAEEMFYLAQELEPDCPHCFFNIGNSLAQRGQTERALYCWERVLDIEPEYPAVRQCIAQAYRTQGKPDEATEYLLAELRDDPGNTDILFELAELALDSGQTSAAAAKFSLIVELDPTCWQAHFRLGKLFLDRNELTEALRCFDTVERITDEPDAPDFDLKVGETCLRLGRLEDAHKRLERAVEEDAQNRPALMLLGDCLLAMGKNEKAADSFRRVLAVDNTDPYAHHNLAVCFFRMGNYRAGLAHCLEALRQKPDYAAALHKVVIAHLRLAQWRQARKMLQIALRNDPENPTLRDLSRQLWRYRLRHYARVVLSQFRKPAER
jgi:tetratricopeptide (TPR) repeat protein